MGRHRGHAGKENHDPYAEGWDAYVAGAGRGENPYVLEVTVVKSIRRSQALVVDFQQWEFGWLAAEDEDINGDGVEGLKPVPAPPPFPVLR